MESEVTYIREIYNSIMSCYSAEMYQEYYFADGITGYYENGILRMITIKQWAEGNAYAKYFYYENNQLLFAYYEGDDAHRFYFKNGRLIRWRYSPNTLDPQNAVNHDQENSEEYRRWETEVLSKSREFI